MRTDLTVCVLEPNLTVLADDVDAGECGSEPVSVAADAGTRSQRSSEFAKCGAVGMNDEPVQWWWWWRRRRRLRDPERGLRRNVVAVAVSPLRKATRCLVAAVVILSAAEMTAVGTVSWHVVIRERCALV